MTKSHFLKKLPPNFTNSQKSWFLKYYWSFLDHLPLPYKFHGSGMRGVLLFQFCQLWATKYKNRSIACTAMFYDKDLLIYVDIFCSHESGKQTDKPTVLFMSCLNLTLNIKEARIFHLFKILFLWWNLSLSSSTFIGFVQNAKFNEIVNKAIILANWNSIFFKQNSKKIKLCSI